MLIRGVQLWAHTETNNYLWIAMKCGADTHGQRGMISNDFGAPLIFHLALPDGQIFHSPSETCPREKKNR